ncbi:MAG: disulfide bond formation protein B [Piscirickettsiaceae bacterium]|nr:disulfide bond formation protein B [Piscirickettsiaceae bacterium]
MLSSRGSFLLGFSFCALMLVIAGYFQLVDHLEPCPLCILQRVFILVVGLVMLLAAIHNPQGIGIRFYGLLAGLVALVGAAISARHVWLQNLPADQVPTCGPGLNFILDNFPLNEAINLVMRGSGECAEVLWTYMGISIPGWTFLAFIMLALLAFRQAFRNK